MLLRRLPADFDLDLDLVLDLDLDHINVLPTTLAATIRPSPGPGRGPSRSPGPGMQAVLQLSVPVATTKFSAFIGRFAGFGGQIAFCFGFCCSGHSYAGEQIEDLIDGYEVRPFCVQADKMSAVLPAVAAHAMVDAEQISVGTVDALPKRNTHLGDRDSTGGTQRKKVFALDKMRAAREGGAVFNVPEDPATVEEVGMTARVSLDLREAFVDPIDAVSAVYHYPVAIPFASASSSRACLSGGPASSQAPPPGHPL